MSNTRLPLLIDKTINSKFFLENKIILSLFNQHQDNLEKNKKPISFGKKKNYHL